MDDFQKLVDQITGELAKKILVNTNHEKLVGKLMTVIYYATKTSDLVDKNVNVMIDS